MKRRDLIKTAMVAAPIAALGLSGCGNKKEVAADSKDNLTIIPKQTDVYKFSAPLVFNHGFIDEMAGYNEKYKKSQIVTLYNSLPNPLAAGYDDWIHFQRGINKDIKSFDDFAKYVKHAQDRGFDFCYLMNSPKPFTNKDFETFEKDFYKLLDNLYNIGVRQIKFANAQVARLINEYNKDFKLAASTILEYHNVGQYANMLGKLNNVNHIVLAKDENQNFKLLKSLKKQFPNITLEVMMGEQCPKCCPSRISCMSVSETWTRPSHLGCEVLMSDKVLNFFKNGDIHPWELEYYSAIGINNFKFVQGVPRAEAQEQSHTGEYMEVIEYGMDSPAAYNYIKSSIQGLTDKKVPDIDKSILLSYYSDIKFFVQHGHECGYKCGSECHYCDNKAKKLKGFFEQIT